MGSTPSNHGRDWAYWVPLVSTLILLAVATKRIKTYVTAQDPYWYIGLAQAILGGRSDPAEFAHGLSYVSPGFPLLLAGCIKLFGVYAPYWLNPILATGFFLLYAELVRNLFPSRNSVLIVVPGTLLILVAGYTLNIHFLLYPFRGMPIYFLAMLGYVLLYLRAGTTGKPWDYLLAGCPFALAVAIREPAIFAAAGAAAWILLHGPIRSPQTWRHLGWFLLPLAMGFTAAALLVIIQGRALNNQLESWLGIVSSTRGANVPATAYAMAGYLVESVHLPGVLLGAWGIWICRRNRAVLCFFLFPAVALFLFYSLYIPHYRYVLSVLVFLCPLICAGALGVVDTLHRRAPGARAPWILAGLVIAAGATTVRSMDPWSRKVSHRQVAAFRNLLDEFAPDGSVAFVDPTCRYLVDALVEYSRLAVRSPMSVRAELNAGRRCFYFEPLDDACYYEGYLDRTLDPPGLPTARILPFYARTKQVLNPDGTPRVIAMANGQFAVQEVVPWDQQVVRQRFVLEGRNRHVIWLDFGEQPPGTVAEAHLEDRTGTVVATWEHIPARHIQGLYAPVSQTGTGLRVLEIRSDTPLAPEPLRGVIPDEERMKFRLDGQRSLSTHYWLSPPFAPPDGTDIQAARLEPGGRLALPVPIGTETMTIAYGLTLTTTPGVPGQQLWVTGSDGARVAWPAQDSPCYATMTLAPPHGRPTAVADLLLTAPQGPPGAQLVDITIRVLDPTGVR